MTNEELEARLSMLEYKVQLLFTDNRSSRLLFEYNITNVQYIRITDVLTEYRDMIDKGEDVSNGEFEERIYAITGLAGDYHFCESLTQALMEERAWEEVFPALYGDMAKYKNYMERRRLGENSMAYFIKCKLEEGYHLVMAELSQDDSFVSVSLAIGEENSDMIDINVPKDEILNVKSVLREKGLLK